MNDVVNGVVNDVVNGVVSDAVTDAMSEDMGATVLIVRGAGAAGRRLAGDLGEAGHRPVVMDERTFAHEGVDSVRVAFGDATGARRAVSDVLRHYRGLDAIVFLPSPAWTTGASAGPAWERNLERELATVAGMVREAAPMLAARSGVVVQVSEPVSPHDPSQPSSLLGSVCGPVIDALAHEFGFRSVPVVTEQVGTARGRVVGSSLLPELVASRRVGSGVGRA